MKMPAVLLNGTSHNDVLALKKKKLVANLEFKILFPPYLSLIWKSTTTFSWNLIFDSTFVFKM